MTELGEYSKHSTKSMGDSIDAINDILEKTNIAGQSIGEASSLVSDSSTIASNVSSALGEQSIATTSIAESTEKLRTMSNTDIERIDILVEEAVKINHSATTLGDSVVNFK